jgi:hypothetical protein
VREVLGFEKGFGTELFGTARTVLSASVNRVAASVPSIISACGFMLYNCALTLLILRGSGGASWLSGYVKPLSSWAFVAREKGSSTCAKSQCCIDEFAEMVHPRDGHPKIFAMIDAYLDESGIHEGAACCVIAGFFGGRGQWKKFEEAWKQLLRDFKVPMEKFHAKHFYPEPKPDTWFNDQWSRRDDCKLFHDAIADTISRYKKIHPVTAGIIVPAFNSFSLNDRRFLTGAKSSIKGELVSQGSPERPYFVPFLMVVRQICEYAPVGGKAHFLFGIDRSFYRYATVLFEQISNDQLRIGSSLEWKDRLGISSAPRAANTAQLQAADFLAYLTYRHMLDTGHLLGAVQPTALLLKCIQNRRSDEDFYFCTKANLEATLEQRADLQRELDDWITSHPEAG